MFDWYLRAEGVLIPLQLLFIMLGMGAALDAKEFGKVVRNPSGVGLGVALQWLFVPLLGQAFILVFRLDPGWAVGILLITVTPGGAMSNLLTFLARGHIALSISVTLVCTLGCIATVPVLLRVFASEYTPPGFVFPAGRIVFEVFAYLLAPMGTGMLVYRFLPRYAKVVSQAAVGVSVALVVTIALGALGSGRIQVVEYGWKAPLLILLFAVTVHLISGEVCRLFKRYDDETVALSIEVSLRNGGVGLLLVHHFFPGKPEQGHALYTLLFYTGLQLWICLPILFRHRFGSSPLWFHKPFRRPEEPKDVDTRPERSPN